MRRVLGAVEMSVCDRGLVGTRCFLFQSELVHVSGSGNELRGGSLVSLQTVFMLLLEPHVSVTFSAFFLSLICILSPSVKFQMPEAPSVY